MRRGAPVSSEQLVEELWGERAPSAVKSVQVRIAELRRALPAGVLVTTPDGYVLRPESVDAERFEAEVAAARDSDAPAARLRAALDLWHRGAA